MQGKSTEQDGNNGAMNRIPFHGKFGFTEIKTITIRFGLNRLGSSPHQIEA